MNNDGQNSMNEEYKKKIEEEIKDYDSLKKKYQTKAEEYMKDKEKTKKLLDEAMKKAKKQGPLEEIWENIQLMFGLLKDWLSGEYNVSKGTIVAIIIGLIYFVAPFDVVPDFIPFFGYLDDAVVLGIIIKQIQFELDEYKKWKYEYK